MAPKSYTLGPKLMWRTADAKPTKLPDGSPLPVGTIGTELDTGVDYIWDGAAWYSVTL